MKSMTGFGHHRMQKDQWVFEISVKSVNGRFLENRFHIPREIVFLEAEMRQVIQQNFRRGTVDVFVLCKKNQTSGSQIKINEENLIAYQKDIKRIGKKLKVPVELSMTDLMGFPYVVALSEDQGVEALTKSKNDLLMLFKKAVESCHSERKREGQSLQKIIVSALEHLEQLVIKIKALRKDVNKNLEEKLRQRIVERSKDYALDPQRLSQEVSYLLDRADINEETERLEEHLLVMKKFATSKEVEGKKLDFYTQELLREFNTIGSKSQVTSLTQIVVEAKTWVERLREQVQNVE